MMSFATVSTVGARQKRKRGGRRPRPYGIASFVGAYLLSLLVMLAAVILLGPFAIVVYLITGIMLVRFIGNRVRWWRIANNIENVATVKVRAILTWPVTIPRFIATVAIAKWF